MVNYKELFMRHLEENGLKYTEKSENCIRISFKGDAMQTVAVSVIFDNSATLPMVHVMCYEICNFKNKEEMGWRACNRANRESLMIKFFIDEDGDVIAAVSAYLDEGTCGALCLNLVKRLVRTVDYQYRLFTAEVWD